MKELQSMFKKNPYVSRTHVGEEILRTIAAVALRIIPQRLDAAQRAVRTCALERDSGEESDRSRAKRNAVRE